MPHKDIDGYLSVTQVIGCLEKPWKWNWYKYAVKKQGWAGWEACERQSSIGREDGTAFHAVLEAYLLRGLTVPERYKPWQDWYDGAGLKPLMVEPEEPLRCEELMFQGTPDYFADDGGLIIPYDWKYAKQSYAEYGLQLSAYAYLGLKKLFGEVDWKLAPYGKVVRLDKATNEIKVHRYEPLEQYFKVFEGLLRAAQFSKGIGQWKK